MTSYRLHFAKDMGGENNAVVLSQLAHKLPNFIDLPGVKADGGFVENDQLRVVDDCLSDTNALLIAF